MQEITGGLILGTPEKTESEDHRMVILRYTSQADLTISIASPKGEAILADIANFAAGGVTVLITSLESEPGRGASWIPHLAGTSVAPSAPPRATRCSKPPLAGSKQHANVREHSFAKTLDTASHA
ncbi:MAG TPA: hypothetical protein VD789_11740 [Thermomicrobiales bacterium]|nr:hypothetical protein [Thermomicrobiales bacterium]